MKDPKAPSIATPEGIKFFEEGAMSWMNSSVQYCLECEPQLLLFCSGCSVACEWRLLWFGQTWATVQTRVRDCAKASQCGVWKGRSTRRI